MLVHDLLDIPELRLTVLTGEAELDREVGGVFTTDLPDPGRYLTENDLVLTGLVWHRDPADSERFVAALARGKVAALGAGEAALGSVPDDLVERCRRHGIPLLAVPVETSFATITEVVVRQLSGQRVSSLARVLGRHRRLVDAVADGAGLDALFGQADLGIGCWVLSATGRPLAGTEPPAPPDLAERLAGEFLVADRLPGTVAAGGATYSLFPVRPATTPRVTGWVLACAGDHETWPDELRESVRELAAAVALERARGEEGLRVEGRLADQLVRLVVSGGADWSELTSRLGTCGLAPDETFVVVSAAVSGASRPGELARDILQEILYPSERRAAVAVLDDDAVALVPVTAGAVPALAGEVRRAAGSLEPGLGPGRLTVGMSGVASGTALRGTVEEAQHARRLAALRPGRSRVVAAADLHSHVLLLAAVPDDIRRSFRGRLLGPLLSYDEEHGSDLVGTLAAFLDCSGSWNRCAARLHVHVNTLRYRIGRIEALTGRDLGSLEDRVDFFLALRST